MDPMLDRRDSDLIARYLRAGISLAASRMSGVKTVKASICLW